MKFSSKTFCYLLSCFLCLTLVTVRCDDEEEEIGSSEFGSKIEKANTNNLRRENAKPAIRPLDPMLALQNLIKAKSRNPSGLPPGVVIKPGASMGLGSLSFGNLTIDPNNLNIDKKLLANLKKMMPGVANVEDIQDELNGLLFGNSNNNGNNNNNSEEKTSTEEAVKAEPFVPSLPDTRFNRKRIRETTTTATTTLSTTTTTAATSTTTETTTSKAGFSISRPQSNIPKYRNETKQQNKATSSGKVVVDGDRAEFNDYDYRDYDLYAYSDEDEENAEPRNLNVTSDDEDLLPSAAEQRQRRPMLQRRRIGGGPNNRVGPGGRVRGRRRQVGGRRSELVDLEDLYEDYRAPPIQDIPGRIQGLPHDNIGALNEELVLNEEYEDEYIPPQQPSFNAGQSRRNQKPSLDDDGPESLSAPVSNNVDCDFYTTDLCLDVNRYPSGEIVGLLSANRRVGADLIADVIDQSADNLVDGVTAAQENRYTFAHYYGNRREDGANHVHRDFAQEGGFLCPSEIKYAKPKRGKTAQGVWKDIVNVNDYTQTLRMEKCLKPGGGCSYVSHHYKSQCSQVYNYHRLLSWDKARGLHMDIYKVPTCCSCHIMGYSYIYPPLNTPAGRLGEPTQELFQTSPISPAISSASIEPEVHQNNEFQSFINQVSNKLPFSRPGPISDPGASNPSISAARPPPPPPALEPTPPPSPPGRPQRPRLNQQKRRPGLIPRPPNSKLIPPRRRIDEGNRKNPLQRLMDQNFFGSDVVETSVAAPPEMFGEGEADHKYESIPIYEEENNLEGKAASLIDTSDDGDDEEVAEEEEEDEAPEEGSTQKTYLPTETDRKQEAKDQPKSLSVNYGYHPIIDFFDRYRFDAAAAK